MRELAITVIGRDRPGIVADTAEILARLGLNLTDSTMTRLRGHFAMTLVCTGARSSMGETEQPSAGDTGVAGVEAALAPLTVDGSLVVTVRELGAESEPTPGGGHFVLSLHGADRLGIVAAVTRLLADAGGNVTDLTTRLTGELYVLVAEVDLPGDVDIEQLDARLLRVTTQLGVEAHLRRADVDVL